MKNLVKYATINSLATFLYIVLISSLMYFLENSQMVANKTIFGSIAFLMLFVFSAALTGSLVFGRPLMLYLDGKKKEALLLLFYTLGILFVLIIIVFISLIAMVD